MSCAIKYSIYPPTIGKKEKIQSNENNKKKKQIRGDFLGYFWVVKLEKILFFFVEERKTVKKNNLFITCAVDYF